MLAGITRVGSVFLLSVASSVHLEVSLLPRSSTKLGSCLLVLSASSFGPVVPMRDHARLESLAFAFGAACSGSVFKLSVTDRAHLGASLLVHESARADSALSVSGFMQLGPPTLLQRFARLGSAASPAGQCRLGSVVLALGSATLDSLLPVKKLA